MNEIILLDPLFIFRVNDLNIDIYDDERVDDLQYKGLRIIQKKNGFCFGVDAVLLANFANVKEGETAVDFGTGTGIIPILLSGKTKAKTIHGIEIQNEIAQMAQRSVLLNDLEDKIKIHHMDLKESVNLFGKGNIDVVVSNPPYMNGGSGLLNSTDHKSVSRHEILCTLEDVISRSSSLLKYQGSLYMVHRPNRLVDIFYLMRQYKIEPKLIRFVHPKPDKEANLVLIRGNKFGNVELKMMKPLYIYNEFGKYSKEIDEIYERGKW